MMRVVTLIVLIATVIYVIFYGPAPLFNITVALLAFACFREYARISAAQGLAFPAWPAQAIGLLFLFSPVADWRLLLMLAMIASVATLWFTDLSRALPAAASAIFGLLYCYGAWRCALPVRDHSPWWLFFAV